VTGNTQLILSCEHGGKEVPEEFQFALNSPHARQHLNSHRGWDPGSLEVAQFFAEQSGAPLIDSTTSRLLVDLNRSLGHGQLFSRFITPISTEARQAILEQHYHPYRNRVHSGARAVHLSVHTFTPVFRGVKRDLDIGLLFDPSRNLERSLCAAWQRILTTHDTKLRVEWNQPYLGIDDGLTTAMRQRFDDRDYAGVELEINSRVMRRSEQGRRRLWQTLYQSLTDAIKETAVT
jgi:predicted N-formylglutamate amidohydrolase